MADAPRTGTNARFVLSNEEAHGTNYIAGRTQADKLVLTRQSHGPLRVEAKGGKGPKLWEVDETGNAEGVDR